MTAFAHVNGHPAIAIAVHVPGVGPWWADVTLEGDPDLSGAVTIGIGELSLEGTVDPGHSGTHGLQRRMRVVAGAGAWGSLLRARSYHNDAQVRARTVVEDAAREAGETLGDFAPAAERIGVDYVRQAGPASRALEDVIGGVPWWVGYDGVTRVTSRASVAADPAAYQVLEHVPGDRVVVLAVDDPRAVVIGSVLSQGLDEPQTVRELVLEVAPISVRVRAWCGGVDGARGRIAGALRGIVRLVRDEKLFGLWRYRVVRVIGTAEDPDGERLELQAVRRDAGLPDLLAVDMWPGIAGAHSKPALGAEVLVEFVEGDRRLPIVAHFGGRTAPGYVPQRLVLSASSAVVIGSHDADDAPSLASKSNELFDSIAAALDAFCTPLPVANDGGAALQTAVRAVWPGRASGAIPPGPPTPAADVGSTKVVIE
ncbi:hypothetical protein [Sandaracinus amylolyticus]|uniref:Uncharacterized protein n=1 Tax=Sandaracinus amylolyticus TaxID=927083 RepID=A0A0F6W358_9BACT|nr:hypothetical protein [Sandaracinus amylolyticus]AKF06083.1 hypothetical protein DB32_003232 [Sandaracinus amylolyticus]